jgi:DNA polymerase-3 subunit alpha
MPDFCHLHCHTQYSLLDGAAGIEPLLKQAKHLDISSVAITDHGNLYGVPEFWAKANEIGVDPIYGCEFYVTPYGMDDRDDDTRYHQVLLAKNETGYQNLMKLSSLSYTDGFYYKPRLDKATIREHSDGLVATTCCLQSEILQTILDKGEEAARPIFEEYLDIFGEDYYIEIQTHDIDDQHICNEVLLRWAKEYDVPVVATNDVHYAEQSDAAAQDVLLCLQTGKDYHDPNRMRFENDQFYLKSPDEMQDALADLPRPYQREAMETSMEIARKCRFDLSTGDLLMPHYPVPEEYGEDMDAFLRDMVFERAQKRYGEDLPQRVVERLNHELGIIGQMGYAGYFLIVQDFTEAAREMDVRVGPGRGSAAGSCVSYCLGITDIDPLEYDLLFERFLNPQRDTMPDIDIDFDDRGRSKVIDYVVQKYGRENVCQITTIGTMGAKTAIRDVSRVLGIPLDEVDRITDMVPDGPGVDLQDAFDEVPKFRRLKEHDDKQIREMMHYAEVLEGSARHTGVHAAGVIITPGKVSDYVPISTTTSKDERVVTTQYEGDWIEEFGLLKMDFLGLKTLTVLNDTVRFVRENHGVEIDLDEIPLDDEKTYELFQKADTTSIFQFESDGMREWLRKLKPTEFNDLIAMNALYRPGPMENIPSYIARKHGEEEVQYPHPLLEDILEPTYGIAVFQEQVMEMARVLAGFSLGEADILRRAMGKKKEKLMRKQRKKFLKGCAEANDIDEDEANRLFDIIAEFAGYGFNKSHSAAYASVAYQSAYLKAHYPAEFMAAAMTNKMDDTDDLADILEEARQKSVDLRPPSINRSAAHFTVEDDSIRYGLAAIKGVGESAIDAVMSCREEHGPFETAFGLTEHLDLSTVNKATLEHLARAGALDDLEGHRAQLVDSVGDLVRHGQKQQADRAAGQNSLFDAGEGDGAPGGFSAEPNLPMVDVWSKSRRLKEERDRMGFYVSGHPLDEYRAEAEEFATAQLGEIDEAFLENTQRSSGGRERYGRKRGPVHSICAIITEVNHHTTKSGKPIAFAEVEDFTGQAKLVCFASVLDNVQSYLEVDNVGLIKGEVELQGGTVKLIVKDITPMWKVRARQVNELVLTVHLDEANVSTVDELHTLCEAHEGGGCKVYLDLVGDGLPGGKQRVRSRSLVVEPGAELMRGATRLLGAENVAVSGGSS